MARKRRKKQRRRGLSDARIDRLSTVLLWTDALLFFAVLAHSQG